MKKFKKILVAASCAILAAAILAVSAFFYYSKNLPSIEEIAQRQISQSTKIYDRTGTVLLYEISNSEQRTVVPLETIPKYLRDATVAVEDEKFYEEPAFDWKAIMRAFFVNLLHGSIMQGGSTITQQLAKNAFLSGEQTISRKIKEFVLAIKLNKYYSKDQILSLYLNEIPYGSTIYGVEAASEAYFGKPVQDLNLAESALFAAIPKAPTYYSPWGSHTKELISREQFILNKMYGLGKITKQERDAAVKYKLTFSPQGHGIKAPHFVMAVQDYLVQKYGEDIVREGGLRVITTLDWNLEQAAEKAVKAGAEQNQALYEGYNAALVTEDPKTGQILAMAGSRDYFATSSLPIGCTPGTNCEFEPNFNVATQGLRQPGSSLKPFVYLTAFQKGYTPDTVVFDLPTEFAASNPKCPPTPDFQNDDPECFHPENFDGQFRGPVSLKQALAQSINVPSVKVLYLAGLSDSVKNAYNFGLTTLTSPDLYGLSLVLGGGAVKLVDLVGAYSVLAADGIKHAQSMVLEVKDSNGSVLESYKYQSAQVADSQPVRLINNILSDANARSGLFQNSLSLTVFPDRDVALKTGTSNDYHDAWTVGYTPSLVAGVWAGNNDNSPMQRHGSSILAAVPIWHGFMAEAVKNLTVETFNRPDPLYPQKPILAGNYTYDNQIHSILYYVSRNNPTGPAPQNPASDSQFDNWEYGVLAWAAQNIPDFKNYNQPLTQTNGTGTATFSNSSPQVKINEPASGDFINNEVGVDASLTGSNNLTKAEVYFNGELARDYVFDPNVKNYDLRLSLSVANLKSQNSLEIEVFDQNNLSGRASVIVYSGPKQ
jgi:membrane peptidoglycan carboxypeptidase